MRIFSSLLLAVLFSACTRNTAANDNGDSPPISGSTQQQTDWSAIEQLESQAKSIANTVGCSAASQCKAAPVGSKACGGPRYYITYCAKSTDSAALYKKLGEVAKAEREYNSKYQVVSTCEYRMPPEVGLSGGICAAK